MLEGEMPVYSPSIETTLPKTGATDAVAG